MDILVIPDKFKGTLSAAAAARAIARGWLKARPKDRLTLLPMTDGGDGFGQIMSRLLGAKIQKTRTLDAAHRPCVVSWWWARQSRTAVIESARVIGLAMLPRKKFHPFQLDTFGLGAVFKAAAARGAKHCLVGIGGSATNDGGFGLARALGWQFRDHRGKSITKWVELKSLKKIVKTDSWQPAFQVTVGVDVRNPLLGRNGATRIYGPQKGLRRSDFDRAEACLRELARIWKRDFGKRIDRTPGAGAAGGLGFGLMAFLGGRLEAGFDLFARYAGLEKELRSRELVLTGEGAIDRSTFMGKGVGHLALRCRERKIPCIALAGTLPKKVRGPRVFSRTYALSEIAGDKPTETHASYWLERLATHAAKESKAG